MTNITTQAMTVVIDKKELVTLLIAQETLRRLNNCGVDTWEWYGESLNPEDEPDFDDICEQIGKDVDVRVG